MTVLNALASYATPKAVDGWKRPPYFDAAGIYSNQDRTFTADYATGHGSVVSNRDIKAGDKIYLEILMGGSFPALSSALGLGVLSIVEGTGGVNGFNMSPGDIWGMSYNYDTQTSSYYRNGVLQLTIVDEHYSAPAVRIICRQFVYSAGQSVSATTKFKASEFTYGIPSGYTAYVPA